MADGSYQLVRQRWAGSLLEDAVLEAAPRCTVAVDAVAAEPVQAAGSVPAAGSLRDRLGCRCELGVGRRGPMQGQVGRRGCVGRGQCRPTGSDAAGGPACRPQGSVGCGVGPAQC